MDHTTTLAHLSAPRRHVRTREQFPRLLGIAALVKYVMASSHFLFAFSEDPWDTR
jgi:hypothetical protein